MTTEYLPTGTLVANLTDTQVVRAIVLGCWADGSMLLADTDGIGIARMAPDRIETVADWASDEAEQACEGLLIRLGRTTEHERLAAEMVANMLAMGVGEVMFLEAGQ
jgi:hypothetical protein